MEWMEESWQEIIQNTPGGNKIKYTVITNLSTGPKLIEFQFSIISPIPSPPPSLPLCLLLYVCICEYPQRRDACLMMRGLH